MVHVVNTLFKGPSTQIVGFQGPKIIPSMDCCDLKPYYLGTWTLWACCCRSIMEYFGFRK